MRVNLASIRNRGIELSLTVLVAFHLVEDHITVNERGSNIDNDITIHDTTVVTAAIDIATFQTAVVVSSNTGDGFW